ncbi:hypothetical protein MTR67_017910 [Solanum verrucosum]|uniref:Uncharacterized protein n=1 Tax=Solanum verrucosum TaxID=315347 RepID=A0AAF0QNT5_SOLVR|nr:hypothetical protein MTR67_017910 [Solanum verrucosum]
MSKNPGIKLGMKGLVWDIKGRRHYGRGSRYGDAAIMGWAATRLGVVHLTSYYRRFVMNIPSIDRHLTRLTQKEVPFDKYEESFQRLMTLLTPTSILTLPIEGRDMARQDDRAQCYAFPGKNEAEASDAVITVKDAQYKVKSIQAKLLAAQSRQKKHADHKTI